jgi:hypothetical protein
MRRILLTACSLAAVAIVTPAGAQPNDSNISLNAPGLLPKKPKPGLPEVKPQPLAWPRLDAGSVMCRSEDDLNRLAQRRVGGPVEGVVDCQVIRAPTPITIIQRKGPGRTEVKATGSQTMSSGWTDAWLPEKAPRSGTSAAR